jgi:hypothetical protein
MKKEGPHRVIGEVANSVVDGISGFGNGAVGIIEDAGEAAMTALDKPFTDLTGVEGPHRVIDRVAKGTINGFNNFANRGVIDSVKIAGEGVMSALDQPLEQIGKMELKLPKVLGK